MDGRKKADVVPAYDSLGVKPESKKGLENIMRYFACNYPALQCSQIPQIVKMM